MRRLFPFLTVLVLVLLCSGCVKALGVRRPTPVQMRVASPQPQRYLVRVTSGEPVDYPVAPDGTVAFSVPGYRGCSTYLFGVKIGDGPGDGDSVVEFRRGQRVVRRLSLRQIVNLPSDDVGYRVLKLKD